MEEARNPQPNMALFAIKMMVSIIGIGLVLLLLYILGVIKSDIGSALEWGNTVIIILYFGRMLSEQFYQAMYKEIEFRSEKINTLVVPVIVAIGMRLFLNISAVIPMIFGGDIITPAKGQRIGSMLYSFDALIFDALIPSIMEEFLFRVFGFTLIVFIVNAICRKINVSYRLNISNLRNKLAWIIIIIINILFALAHFPNASNFYAYFIPGVVFSIIYIRYGYFSAVITHFLVNYLGLVNISTWIIKYLLEI